MRDQQGREENQGGEIVPKPEEYVARGRLANSGGSSEESK